MAIIERIQAEISGHPIVLFMKGTPQFPMCGFSSRTVGALREAGADMLFVLPFDRNLADKSPEAFVKTVLCDGLGVRHVVIGHNFRFGQGRSGSDALNRALHAARLALYAAKTLKDVKANIDGFAGDSNFTGQFLVRSRDRIARTHTRMEALLQPDTPNEDRQPDEVAALEQWMQEDDTTCLHELSIAAREGLLKERDLGTAMQMQRAIAQSSHDLLKALAEMQGAVAEEQAEDRVNA